MNAPAYVLYGSLGTGSAITECMLALCGIPYRLRNLDYEKDVIGENAELKSLNPLSRVPTLMLPSGEILTESGAIALHLGGGKNGDRLVPPANSPLSPLFLRMLFLINGEIYPTFTFADIPSEWVSNESAQEELKNSIKAFRNDLWRLLESWIPSPGPWALGERYSAIDCYLGVMVNWGPGREWFKKNTPKISAIADLLREHPEACPVLKKNFPKA